MQNLKRILHESLHWFFRESLRSSGTARSPWSGELALAVALTTYNNLPSVLLTSQQFKHCFLKYTELPLLHSFPPSPPPIWPFLKFPAVFSQSLCQRYGQNSTENSTGHSLVAWCSLLVTSHRSQVPKQMWKTQFVIMPQWYSEWSSQFWICTLQKQSYLVYGKKSGKW